MTITDKRTALTRMHVGVPDDETLWIADWLFYAPITQRHSGGHGIEGGFGYSGLLGEIRRARAAYAELREEAAR